MKFLKDLKNKAREKSGQQEIANRNPPGPSSMPIQAPMRAYGEDPADTPFSRALRELIAARDVPGQPLPPSLRKRLDEFDRAKAALEHEGLDLAWRAMHGENVGKALKELEEKNIVLVASTGYVEMVRAGFPPATGLDRRELELRQRELLINEVRSFPDIGKLRYIALRMQDSLSVAIGSVSFSQNEIDQIISSCPDSSLRADAVVAKEKSREALGPSKLALSSGLNDVARELSGRESYAHLLLEAQDSDVSELRRMILSFEGRTRDMMGALTSAVCRTLGLGSISYPERDFHYNQYFSAANPGSIPINPAYALEKLRLTLRAMGFSGFDFEIDKPPFTLDISGGKGYSTEECAMRAAPGIKDYRVFVNPEVSPSGVEYNRTVLLETGRAVHFNALERIEARDAFKWDSDCMRSAIAMLFGSVTSEEKWARDIAGLHPDDARVLSTMMRFSNMYMARNLATNALFELDLYAGETPEAAYRKACELFHGAPISEPVERHWAWHPYLASNPGGQLGYALGYFIYEMIREDVTERFGSLLHEGVAQYLSENYMTGHASPWPKRLEDIFNKGAKG